MHIANTKAFINQVWRSKRQFKQVYEDLSFCNPNKENLSIVYSSEDKCYIASMPKYPGLKAHGNTWSQAMHELSIAYTLMKETDAQK